MRSRSRSRAMLDAGDSARLGSSAAVALAAAQRRATRRLPCTARPVRYADTALRSHARGRGRTLRDCEQRLRFRADEPLAQEDLPLIPQPLEQLSSTLSPPPPPGSRSAPPRWCTPRAWRVRHGRACKGPPPTATSIRLVAAAFAAFAATALEAFAAFAAADAFRSAFAVVFGGLRRRCLRRGPSTPSPPSQEEQPSRPSLPWQPWQPQKAPFVASAAFAAAAAFDDHRQVRRGCLRTSSQKALAAFVAAAAFAAFVAFNALAAAAAVTVAAAEPPFVFLAAFAAAVAPSLP